MPIRPETSLVSRRAWRLAVLVPTPLPRSAAAVSTSSRLVMCPTRNAVSAIARACANSQVLAQSQDRSQDRRHLGPYLVSTKIRVVEFNAVRRVDAASVARNRDMELGRRHQYAQLPDLGRTEVRDDTPKSLHPSSVQSLGQAVRPRDGRATESCSRRH